MSQSTVIHDLFNVEQYVQLGTELHPTTAADEAESSEHNCHFGLLVLFVIFKFGATLVSINLPVPAGCFAPVSTLLAWPFARAHCVLYDCYRSPENYNVHTVDCVLPVLVHHQLL